MLMEKINATRKLKLLEEKGYVGHLMFKNNAISDLSSGREYSIQDIAKIEEYRFEGISNPSDMSMLFAIEFKDGFQGTLSAAFGPDGDADLFEFMNQATESK